MWTARSTAEREREREKRREREKGAGAGHRLLSRSVLGMLNKAYTPGASKQAGGRADNFLDMINTCNTVKLSISVKYLYSSGTFFLSFFFLSFFLFFEGGYKLAQENLSPVSKAQNKSQSTF